MGEIKSSENLMNHTANMVRDNSVLPFPLRGKGKFTLVLQEEEESSIQSDIKKSQL